VPVGLSALLGAKVETKLEVVVEKGAGLPAGFTDAQYLEKGARLGTRDEVFAADVIVQVRAPGANPERGRADLERMRTDQVVIGFSEPLGAPRDAALLAQRGVVLFAMELIPRITRAQSMDALSSMATVAGSRACSRS
jgi:H+-translocating NAD(P) transhydrogenase subunit alpha